RPHRCAERGCGNEGDRHALIGDPVKARRRDADDRVRSRSDAEPATYYGRGAAVLTLPVVVAQHRHGLAGWKLIFLRAEEAPENRPRVEEVEEVRRDGRNESLPSLDPITDGDVSIGKRGNARRSFRPALQRDEARILHDPLDEPLAVGL